MSDYTDNIKDWRAPLYMLKDCSPNETVNVYSEVASDYDKGHQTLNVTTHEGPSNMLLKIIEEKYETDLNLSCSVLDIGAGTGAIGEYLRAKGFDGPIDGQDGSQTMLDILKRKNNIYRSTFCHVIEPQTQMPEHLRNGSYDVVVTSGTMRPFFIHYKSLKHFINAVKNGGLIIFHVRSACNEELLEYHVGLQREIFRLEKSGVWKLIDLHYQRKFRDLPTNPSKEEIDRLPLSCLVYCFKKLTSAEVE